MRLSETTARRVLIAWYLLCLLRGAGAILWQQWELAAWIGVALVLSVLWQRQLRWHRHAGITLDRCAEHLDAQQDAIIRLYAKAVRLRGSRQ